jgi:hypothetical protein
MKNISRIVSFGLSLLFFVGCATPTLHVSYLVPPEKIVDINSIDVIKVNASTKLAGNVFNGSYNEAYVNGLISSRINARLTQTGYFKTIDSVWGDVDGVSSLSKIIESKNHAHGYSNFTTDSEIKAAKLNIKIEADVKKSKYRKTSTYYLYTTPYIKEYADKKPISKPDEENQQKRIVEYTGEVEELSGSANVFVEVIDKNGIKVYEREFNDVKYNRAVGMVLQESLPTGLNAVGEMVLPVIEEVIKDIAPHIEIKQPILNEDGDERAILLLRAQAFSEAIELLENPDLFEKFEIGDYENLALAYEVIGDLFSAKYNFEKALEIDNASVISIEGIERINLIVEKQKKLNEMSASKSKTDETTFKSDK